MNCSNVITMAGLSKNSMIAIIIAIIVVVAGASAAYILLNDDEKPKEAFYLPGNLKILGNADLDGDLDNDDISEINRIIDERGMIDRYPLADANNDGEINKDDVDFVKAILNHTPGSPQVPVWHINYHDNGKGVMYQELAKTMYPVSSVVATGSSNMLMMLQLMDIVDEVKGICHGTVDTALFDTTYLDTSKVTNLGDNTGVITFEDGKVGSSNVIAEQNVTTVITDWNKTYIDNEDDFEKGNIDVVRIAAAAVDRETYTHSISLLGFLFQKTDRATSLLALYDECNTLIEKNKSDGSLKACASSMSNPNKYAYVSSPDSDYTEVILAAGLSFGLPDIDFEGKTSFDTWKNLDIYNTELNHWDYTIHIRTNINYSGVINTTTLKGYTDAFCKYWEYQNGEHQYLISGGIPVPIRVLYVESIFNDDLTVEQVDALHAKFVQDFFIKSDLDISSMQFFVDGTTLYT